MQVRIIAIPPGEAPESVRRAWVGLVLPLAPECRGPVEAVGYGVLSRRFELGAFRRLWRWLVRRPLRQYAVPTNEAMAILAAAAPDAARWWRENAPDVFAAGNKFWFAAEACEELE